VVVGRSDRDAVGLQRLVVADGDHRQRARPPEDVRQQAGSGCRKVEHHNDGSPDLVGQATDELGVLQRPRTTRR
jgi:hypothetical protein